MDRALQGPAAMPRRATSATPRNVAACGAAVAIAGCRLALIGSTPPEDPAPDPAPSTPSSAPSSSAFVPSDDGPDGASDAGEAGRAHDARTEDSASVDSPTQASAYRGAVLADGPLAYWRLDEGPGATLCRDETGHGNDAMVVGGVVLGVAGALRNESKGAAHFDGAAAALDAGDKFDFAARAPFSFEAWIKPDVIDQAFRFVLSKMAYDASLNPYDGTYLFVSAGATQLGFEQWAGGGNPLALAAGAQAGSWSHVVATFDGTNATLFVDGALASTMPSTQAVVPNLVHFKWGDTFAGVLDELAVYDHPLSQQRVQVHRLAAAQ
jgi:hypothetical protein